MEAYFLQTPTNQKFYRGLATAFSIMGLGDQSWWGYERPNILIRINAGFIWCLTPVVLISQFMYLFVNMHKLTFTILGTVFSILPVTMIVYVAEISARFKTTQKIMKVFIKKIHLHNFINGNEFSQKKLIEIERYTRWTAYYLTVFLTMSCLTWIFIPVVNNIRLQEFIKNKTLPLQTSIYLLMPFDYTYNYRNWLIIHICNAYSTWVGCNVMLVFNILNFIFIFHLIGHIQILKHKFMTIENDLSDDEVKKRLVDIIRYHSFILSTFKDIQLSFGLYVATNYCQNLIGDSLIMYQIMYGNKFMKISYGLMMPIHMGGLILMSLVLEEIRKQTSDLPEVVYNVPWERMSISNQRIVRMILARVQEEVQFQCSGGFKAGVRPMVNSYSFASVVYIILRVYTTETNGHTTK